MTFDSPAGEFQQTDADLYRVQRNRLLAAFENLRAAPLITRLGWAIHPGGLCDHKIPVHHPAHDFPARGECPMCGQRT